MNTISPLERDTTNTNSTDLKVIKRNGEVVSYNEDKIIVAMSKAYLAVEGSEAENSARIRDLVVELTADITRKLLKRASHAVHIEEIQDLVELSLMRQGEHKVARAYVIYREKQAHERAQKQESELHEDDYLVVNYGSRQDITNIEQRKLPKSNIRTKIEAACLDIEHVSSELLYEDVLKACYAGMHIQDLTETLIMVARSFIERDPNYTYVTASLLLNKLTDEALGALDITNTSTTEDTRPTDLEKYYQNAFIAGITLGCKEELIDKRLLEFNVEQLAQQIKPERDKQFTYLGLQTLYDRYFLHTDDLRFELPQSFFMRVAMGLSLEEVNREAQAIEFYHQLSEFNYMSSTPTLFNSGTTHSQMSSCYLTTVADDLRGIYKAISDNAMLSKWAGGLGNDWTSVRAMGSHIKGTNGKSQGVVPFLKVANDTAIAVNQGGKRKGALCSYLETWHLDIEEFLELRKNTGDDRRRTHDMNTANWIPDLFVKRVLANEEWTLFSPVDVPNLHDSYGKKFEELYAAYEAAAERGDIRNFKRIPAKDLWRKMLSMLFETGHPWFTFKDVCNIRSPQQHCGVVHSSNLCTEITLNTNKDEIAVCNLGSINLTRYFDQNGDILVDKLREKVRTAVRMLDNVININFYAVNEARNANKRHRPVGLGIMGFQDVLYLRRIPLASMQAVEFADEIMEYISYFAIEASSDLAVERGAYESYEGSLWSQGILPIDSIRLLKEARGEEFVDMDTSSRLDWGKLRAKIRKQKMRNSNVLAIAPTATIANIVGVVASIEPTFQNLFVKSNMSGEFTCVNQYLAEDLRKLGVWDSVMINDLKYFDGVISEIGRVPQDIKNLYATAFEVDPKWLIEAASRRQKWIDQAQSLNLYINQPSGKKLDEMYKFAWHKGLKTTYYLRSKSATSAEKSTVDRGKLNNVDVNLLKNSKSPQPPSTSAQKAEPQTSAPPSTQASASTTQAQIHIKNFNIDNFEIDTAKACLVEDPECESCQ